MLFTGKSHFSTFFIWNPYQNPIFRLFSPAKSSQKIFFSKKNENVFLIVWIGLKRVEQAQKRFYTIKTRPCGSIWYRGGKFSPPEGSNAKSPPFFLACPLNWNFWRVFRKFKLNGWNLTAARVCLSTQYRYKT